MLKMEVVIPPPTMDFDFNNAKPMPFMSAPSTPKRFGDFSLSAPTSPSRVAEFYGHFDYYAWDANSIPVSPKAVPNNSGDNFAFNFRSELQESSLSAEELFDGGKIRPLKPPPRLHVEERSPLLSPRSPRSPTAQGKKIIREVFSRRKKKDSDPFAVAAENTRRRTENDGKKRSENDRGTERGPALASSSSRRAARSLSPYRVSEYPWEEEERKLRETTKQSTASNSKASVSSNSSSSSSTTKSSSRKWRLRDFLLFRSASEGRAADKDPFRIKYPSFFRKPEDAKTTNFRSTDSSGSVSASTRKGQVSAHELHYTMNKAASEDLKKKTFLPYKQGILGRLAFNPNANGLGNLAR
ncbi:hypothetical protein P3X46_002238 [Hevea brasiliensis]|uniref:Uncharacterized protein n=2 Tax=Hevea brasiliensis TaxID=3981 RepID=A0ABQ9N364_HEVBR|nr:hypothetical protein P3X46_002238 [Hevea brasiliensis]